MSEFDKELERIITSTQLTTDEQLQAIKQAIEKHVVGEDEVSYQGYLVASSKVSVEDNQKHARLVRDVTNHLRKNQRSKLHQK